ncbi:hypothetical protein B0H65DRAFT_201350 [Neurospora tetraspora]|uniref:Secreted protein n=1 Tax=Neurospora tetraspora TaxID=94610 RepID=A0AAE0JF89_9PEZI|nr:hypothetical protein B0H65DRAFT_201350 [Neurospora tetraspora]
MPLGCSCSAAGVAAQWKHIISVILELVNLFECCAASEDQHHQTPRLSRVAQREFRCLPNITGPHCRPFAVGNASGNRPTRKTLPASTGFLPLPALN